LLEILTGALVGAKSGMLVSGEADLGAFMILIDPAAFGSIKEFKTQTDKIVSDILSNPPAKGFSEVRVPGYRSQQLRNHQLQTGSVEVEDIVWQKFTTLYQKVVH
jgi:ureidoglycolate dehydrogenase (NAD+)